MSWRSIRRYTYYTAPVFLKYIRWARSFSMTNIYLTTEHLIIPIEVGLLLRTSYSALLYCCLGYLWASQESVCTKAQQRIKISQASLAVLGNICIGGSRVEQSREGKCKQLFVLMYIICGDCNFKPRFFNLFILVPKHDHCQCWTEEKSNEPAYKSARYDCLYHIASVLQYTSATCLYVLLTMYIVHVCTGIIWLASRLFTIRFL